MARSGNSFTAEEMVERENLIRMIPELETSPEVDERWWREHFDKEKRRMLSIEHGLEERINNGVFKLFDDVSATRVREDCTRIHYAQTKARVFNIIESQFDEGNRLEAIKRAVEDVLSGVSDNIDVYLERSLVVGHKISE